jgi:hypothetical protein
MHFFLFKYSISAELEKAYDIIVRQSGVHFFLFKYSISAELEKAYDIIVRQSGETVRLPRPWSRFSQKTIH